MTSQGGMQRFDESCSYFPKHILHEDPASEESQEPGPHVLFGKVLGEQYSSFARSFVRSFYPSSPETRSGFQA